jgi:outer membrane protein assembly factor BamB
MKFNLVYPVPHAISRILLGLFASIFSTHGRAENWTQFRGANVDGIASSACPTSWTDTKNVRWKVAVAGEGWSQPITWGDKVFITAAVPTDAAQATDLKPEEYQGGGGRRRDDLVSIVYRYEVICLDVMSGKELWRTVARESRPPIPRHSTNTYATETPITDGERVYAYFGMSGVYCLDLDGTLLWKKDLGVFEMRAGWGTSSSPVLFNGKLFLQVDNEQQSFVVALDAKSGEEVWRVNRDEKSQYSSPMVWQNSQRSELILGGMVYRSYDPETGALLWQLDMAKGRSSATPVAKGDRLYVGTELRTRGDEDDGGGYLFAVKPGGKGNITPPEDETSSDFIEWRIERSDIQMASPVICDNRLYLLERQSGNVHCVDLANGETVYRKRLPRATAFWASPWVSGDRVFCPDSSGTTLVLASGPELKVLSTNGIDEQTWASAAVANGALYFRTVDHLYCIAD